MEEIWKDIPNFEGRYQASNLGRIRSLGFYRENPNGYSSKKLFRKGIIMKPTINEKGYFVIHIANNNLIRKHCQVHRLVAQAFIPNPNNFPEVNHINAIKSDNRVENLEWVSSKQNTQHALKMGLRKSYFRPVFQIKNGKVIAEYESIKQASRESGVKRPSISRVLAGHRKRAGGYEWRYNGGKQLKQIIY